jgi:AcrR family transcriptional regulator
LRSTASAGSRSQQIADWADVAIGTLYLYASTKAELLIMVQNEKFAAAIDEGLVTASDAAGQDALEGAIALIRPVVECVRQHVENGRTQLHELIFGDPAEPYRREGLVLAARLEQGIIGVLTRDESIDAAAAALLARVITAVIHVSTSATVYPHRSDAAILADIRDQIGAVLVARRHTA